MRLYQKYIPDVLKLKKKVVLQYGKKVKHEKRTIWFKRLRFSGIVN